MMKTLTLKQRCALGYAAHILYTIPIQQWSNAQDMIDMVEGEPRWVKALNDKQFNRAHYLIDQAMAIWDGAGNNFTAFLPGHEPDAGEIEHWEKFIADKVAAVKVAIAAGEAHAEKEKATA